MIKLLSLFSGIGAPEQALKNIGIDYELVGFSEIDKYAIKSYCAVHGVSESLNLGDITKIDIHSLPKDIDLITHGSPCQSFSIAGKQDGGDKGSGTRSSLMWNTVDIVEHCKPKYVLWENVKNLLSKRHKHNFDSYIEIMDKLGYNNYYKVLNAKDYGIPQNRERIFTISIRKDVDNNTFTFPEPFDNGLRLKDMLEDEVDEKFYLSEEYINRFIYSLENNDFPRGKSYKVLGTTVKPGNEPYDKNTRQWVYDINYPISTLSATENKQPKQILMKIINTPCIVASRGRNPENTSDITPGIHTEQRLEINKNGTSNTLTTVQKDNYVLVKEATKKGYAIAKEGDSINFEQPNSKTRRGRVGHEVSQTLTTSCNQGTLDEYRIRKLTPLECWRLMGFKDEQFNKAQSVCSNSQLYKQAGNSIVVDVLEKIFENIF